MATRQPASVKKSRVYLWIAIPAAIVGIVIMVFVVFIANVADTKRGIDPKTAQSSIQQASPSAITVEFASVSQDGFSHRLDVGLKIPKKYEVSASELNAILRAAYTASKGNVDRIEIMASTTDQSYKSFDLKPAANDLNIEHTSIDDRIFYRMQVLKATYGNI